MTAAMQDGAITGIACGATTCPTCGRPTEMIIGPCQGCHDSWERTGRFLRHAPLRAVESGVSDPTREP